MPAWSGLWNDIGGADYAFLVNQTSLRKRISKLLRQHGGSVDREILLTHNAGDEGDAALKERFKVEHIASPGTGADYGGVRTIETVSKIDRVTTAADTAAMAAMLGEERNQAATADLSGNTGGGMVGV